MTTDKELYDFLTADEDKVSRQPRLDLKKNIEVYKKQALVAAKELLYGSTVLDNIRMAGSIGEIERLLATARKNMKD